MESSKGDLDSGMFPRTSMRGPSELTMLERDMTATEFVVTLAVMAYGSALLLKDAIGDAATRVLSNIQGGA